MTRRPALITEPRLSHVDNVHPIRPAAAVDPRHPSMYDRDDEDHNAHTCVLLTRIEAHAIAGLLRAARGHLPSPKACDDAIQILTKLRP